MNDTKPKPKPMEARVLVVDDDAEFRRFVTIALEEAGFAWEEASSGDEGLAMLRDAPGGHFDLVFLDVQMPGPSGWDLLLEMRESGDEIPVVFVTGLDSVQDRVRGLRMGADDYVVKPVEFEELIARLEAVLRRRRALTPIDYGDLRVDPAMRKVQRNGKPVHLSPREYDLLLVLLRARGEVKSRAELLTEVWDMGFDPGTNVLDVHIGRVRKKLDRFGRPAIETVRGEGYRLLAREPV